MSTAAYSLLHPGVQKAIFRRGWKELHSIQVQSIQELLGGHGHLLICAHTAGGKTEAAFLPIISRLAEKPSSSVRALYVGPLVALINDQFQRLETLCQDVDVPVHRWHGSASASEKKKFRDAPGGILLITPESLESNFINYGRELRRLYTDLEFVVIDEVHSFLSGVRGVHLRSLLSRLFLQIGKKPRFVGLSATLGNPQGARDFLDPDAPDTVRIIEGKGTQSVKFGIKAFLGGELVPGDKLRRWHTGDTLETAQELTSEQIRQPAPLSDAPEDRSFLTDATQDELEEIATDILHTCKEGKNLVFGNAKQGLEVLADRLHRRVKALGWTHDPFHVHHGSLSKAVREETETILKSNLPATVLCSSTLEMGIDIGAVQRVAQLDPPWSVASMRQRLGRSGRREGESARMCVYTRDESPNTRSTLTDLLFPDLLRTIALTRLMLAKWLEPHEHGRLHLSTLIHQILSCLRQTGGTTTEHLYRALVSEGAFRSVSQKLFCEVLKSLGERQIIEQMPDGVLILAPNGEFITADRDFYAAFASTEEFIVRHDGKEIGKLQSSLIPPVGDNLILGGRRWCVSGVEHALKTVFVSPAKGGKAPVFRGTGGEIHNQIVEEMRAVLADSDNPRYVDGAGQILLKAARLIATRSGILNPGYIIRHDSIQWFPWLGTRALLTLKLHAACAGISVEADSLSITYLKTDWPEWRAHLKSIASSEGTALALAQQMPIKTFDKFDELLAESILDEANAQDRLDIHSARCTAEHLISGLS